MKYKKKQKEIKPKKNLTSVIPKKVNSAIHLNSSSVLRGVVDTGQVTVEHRLTNLPFRLASSFFYFVCLLVCLFFAFYCFTSTLFSTQSQSREKMTATAICSHNYLLADENLYNAHINLGHVMLLVQEQLLYSVHPFSYEGIKLQAQSIGNVFMFHSLITKTNPCQNSNNKRSPILPGGESNPGLPRDRRGYSPLYYRGTGTRETSKDALSNRRRSETKCMEVCRPEANSVTWNSFKSGVAFTTGKTFVIPRNI